VGQYERIQLLPVYQIITRQAGPSLSLWMGACVKEQSVSFKLDPPRCCSNV